MTRTNVNPAIWGPPAWKFIGAVVESYPATPTQYDQNWITEFLSALAEALPCEICRNNYNIFIANNPLENHTSSRETITLWLSNYKAWAKAEKSA